MIECVKRVVERGWGRGITCVGCVCEVLVGGLGGSESEVEVGAVRQLKCLSTSLLMCALLMPAQK